MKAILYLVCAASIAVGLWSHDWTAIIAGAGLAVVWPLLGADVYTSYRHHRQLERLWDDDDLANGS